MLTDFDDRPITIEDFLEHFKLLDALLEKLRQNGANVGHVRASLFDLVQCLEGLDPETAKLLEAEMARIKRAEADGR